MTADHSTDLKAPLTWIDHQVGDAFLIDLIFLIAKLTRFLTIVSDFHLLSACMTKRGMVEPVQIVSIKKEVRQERQTSADLVSHLMSEEHRQEEHPCQSDNDGNGHRPRSIGNVDHNHCRNH